MNRRISLGGALTLAIMISTVTFITTMIYAQRTFDGRVFNLKEREIMYAKLAETDRLVRQNYYREIDEEHLRDEIVSGYLDGIGDAHARYISENDMSLLAEEQSGRLVGIGIVCAPSPSGFIIIERVYPDSPALAAGLEAGNLIVKVDELSVSPATYPSAVEAINGEPGTGVELTVRRAGTEDVLLVTRRRVDVPTVSHRLIGNVGYIHIEQFADQTPFQFDTALAELSAGGALGLVLDVRNNPGGLISAAARILDGLLPEGPIVIATYKNSVTEVLYQSDDVYLDIPLAVLQNAKSASAAELFVQALRDYRRALSVGSVSKGKGTMQKMFSLSDGSAIDLTVAAYSLPFSNNFDGVGIKPDYEVKLSPDQELNFDMLDEHSDPQLKKAIEIVETALRDIYGPSLPGQSDVVEISPQRPEPEQPGFDGQPDDANGDDDVFSVGAQQPAL
jgi:carboxyl-terminal processing protease